MSATGARPRAAIVFDVNVLIDAANPYSRNHAAAVRALSDDNAMPIYFSDTMLRTTANKLLEMGADPAVVHEYIELIMSDDDYGPEKHTIDRVAVTDYELIDKHGNPDYEDSTIISLMDAAEARASLPAVLVSNDGALRDWCAENQRMAVRPDALHRLSSHMTDEVRHATYQYTSRRMFREGSSTVAPAETKSQARQIVKSIRTEIDNSRAPQPKQSGAVYARFPELRPHETPSPTNEELDSLSR